MDFVYYIVRKKDSVIVDFSDDIVGAIKKAQEYEGAYLIMQGCVITEIGQDNENQLTIDSDNNNDIEVVEEPLADDDFVETEFI